jgi:hypothetical protein
LPNKSQCDESAMNIMNQYDLDGSMPDGLNFNVPSNNLTIPKDTYVDHGFDLSCRLTVPVESDTYKGSSKFRLSPESVAIDSNIIVPKITPKQPFKGSRYKEPFNPPEVVAKKVEKAVRRS